VPLTLPVLTVINREMTVVDEQIQETLDSDILGTTVQGITPYSYSHVAIPIYEDDKDMNTAQLDYHGIQIALSERHAGGTEDERRAAAAPPGQRLDRFVLAEVGARFIAPPGDPSPFVRRDPGALDCGALSGAAAVYCAVMARR
jgi:hypothetical protein